LLKRIPHAIIAVFIVFIASIVLPLTINLVTGGTAPHALKPYSHYYWPIIAGSFLVLAIYTLPAVFNKRLPTAATHTSTHPNNRPKALSEIQSYINSRLVNSLSRLARITLNMDDASELITKPEHLIVQSSTGVGVSEPRRDIMRTFTDYDESILILGAPGSGKSTTLLELAQQLCDRAIADTDQAMPIVLELARWAARIMPPTPPHAGSAQNDHDLRDLHGQPQRALASRRQATKTEGGLGRDIEFSEWLLREMNRQYHIPRRVGEQWLRDRKIILLLDGLDEMPTSVRDECVKSINKFQDTFDLPGTAITCRLEDYRNIASQLTLQGAVKIRPLTRAQIGHYLDAAGDRLRGVRTALDADRTLWELLDSPLMLSIMAIAYHDRLIDTRQLGKTVQERRNKLTESYVAEVLIRRPAPVTHFSTRETRRWLAVIAHSASIGNLMPLGPRPAGLAMRWSYSAPEAAVRLLLSASFPWLVGLVCAAGVILPVGLRYGSTTALLAVAPVSVFQLSYLGLTKPVLRRRHGRAAAYEPIRRIGVAVGASVGLACFGILTTVRDVVMPSVAIRSLVVAAILVGGLRLVYRLEEVIRPSLIEPCYWLAIIVGGAALLWMYRWHPIARELSWFFLTGFASSLSFAIVGRQIFTLIDQDPNVKLLQRKIDWKSSRIPVLFILGTALVVTIAVQRSGTGPVVTLLGVTSGVICAIFLGPLVSFMIGLFISPASFVMACMYMLPFRLKSFLYYTTDRSLLYRNARSFIFIHAIFQDYFLKQYGLMSSELEKSVYPPRPAPRRSRRTSRSQRQREQPRATA
jgi:hypothetical protein